MQQRPIDTAGQAAPPEPRRAKPRCGGLWKVFGPRAERFPAEHGSDPTPGQLAEAGLTAAVRLDFVACTDASLAPFEGALARLREM